MSRKAMQVALEALESDPISHAGLVTVLSPGKGTGLNYARASQKTAVSPDGGTGFIDGVWHGLEPKKKEWVGLTDQEVMVAAYQAGFDIHEDYENEDDPEAMHWWTPDGEACDDSLLKLRDLIEAKLKEKNQ